VIDDSNLMASVTKSQNLQQRAMENKRFGTADFSGWVDSLLSSVTYKSVLDVCCGTGNQLVLFAAKEDIDRICGVDLSAESLEIARERMAGQGVGKRTSLFQVGMEEMFAEPELASEKYELISCFYGLYYARDASDVLEQMQDHLTNDGAILIVGPYGENNASFFELLSRHFSLPELVVRSAATFMENEVYPVLAERAPVTRRTFVNPIRFPDPSTLINYWRSSTFFSAEHEAAVVADIRKHLEQHGEFVIEKHVMAYLSGNGRS